MRLRASADVAAGPSLTRRATLTAASAVGRQAARGVVQLSMVRAIVHGIGTEAYGAFAVAQQVGAYAGSADLRAAGSLKFLLATRQRDFDDAGKRRLVGASVAVWFATLPIAAAVTVVFALVVGSDLGAGAPARSTVHLVAAVLAASTVVDRGLSVFASALRGSNLDYYTAPTDVVAIVVGGALAVVLAVQTENLVAVAASSLVTVAIMNVGHAAIARRAVPWFGVERPHRSDLTLLASTSGWLLTAEVGAALLFTSDLVVIGAVAGADSAAVFAATSLVVRLANGPVAELLSAGTPGAATLVAAAEWRRFAQARIEILAGAVLLSGGVAVVVGLFNELIVETVAASELFGGTSLTAILAVTMVVTGMLRADAALADAMLALRPRAIATVAIAAATVVGSMIAARSSITAVAAVHLVGRLALVVLVAGIVGASARAAGGSVSRELRWLTYRLAASCSIAVGCALVGARLDSLALGHHLALGGLVLIAALALLWTAALGPADRRGLRRRYRVLLGREET